MIRLYDLKIKANESVEVLPLKASKRLHLSKEELKSFSICKESIDARKKPDIYKVYTVEFECENEDKILFFCSKNKIKAESCEKEKPIEFPQYKSETRPVVVGFGPCGMFAALALAKMGLKPLVLERGPAMDERVALVEKFWKTGELDFKGNCQFGEGGAGTFSDGKLTTGTKSIYQRFVLEEFVRFGAAPEILYRQKPHIGTDILRTVVVKLRKEIESLGGEVLFNTQMKDVIFSNGKLSSVVLENGDTVPASAVILALGHSARDSVRMLFEKGVYMEPKQFSMGVRIEHPQKLIDISQYGKESKELGLGPADYKLNVRTKAGRGVYTFCMCPGGVVVNASSHEGCVTCNGMSYFKRDSGKANSALLCDVRPDDYGTDSPLNGIAFQEKYEKLAFNLSSSYALPNEKLKSFMTDSKVKDCLPPFVYESLKEAVPVLGKKLKGFDSPDADIYAIESRSSSPVRITRDEMGFARLGEMPVLGLYPAGEGAGYAGGIMSAACDGIRTAFKAAEYLGGIGNDN